MFGVILLISSWLFCALSFIVVTIRQKKGVNKVKPGVSAYVFYCFAISALLIVISLTILLPMDSVERMLLPVVIERFIYRVFITGCILMSASIPGGIISLMLNKKVRALINGSGGQCPQCSIELQPIVDSAAQPIIFSYHATKHMVTGQQPQTIETARKKAIEGGLKCHCGNEIKKI